MSFNWLINEIKDWVRKQLSPISDRFPSVINYLKGYARDLYNSGKSYSDSRLSAAKNYVDSKTSGLRDYLDSRVREIYTGIRTAIAELRVKVKEDLGPAFATINDKIAAIHVLIANLRTELIDYIKDYVKDKVPALIKKTLKGWLVIISDSMSEGFKLANTYLKELTQTEAEKGME